MKVNLRQVDHPFAPGSKHRASPIEVRWYAKFVRENVDRPQRQHTQTHACERIRHITNTVQDFIHGAVATGSDDQFETFADRFCCQRPRIPGGDRRFQRRVRREIIQMLSEMPCLVASRRWVKNDASLQHDSDH